MAEIKSGAMLAVTENEICEPAAKGLQSAGIVVEPVVFPLQVSLNGGLEIGNDEAHTSTWPKNPPAFREEPPQFIVVEMLEHVGGINGSHGAVGKGQTIAHIEPEVDFALRIGVNIHKIRQIIRTAAKVKVDWNAILPE